MTLPDAQIHTISESTGETLAAATRAALAQFDGVKPRVRAHTMVRNATDLDPVLAMIKDAPGPVLHTVVDPALRAQLESECARLGVASTAVLDPVIGALSAYLHASARNRPGAQYATDREYFARIAAIDFALANDDGALASRLQEADVVLIGVSRTSKTPTCVYLAGRGVKAANVPLVPGTPVPALLFELGPEGPLIVGLTAKPSRLTQIRANRLSALQQDEDEDYADPEAVTREVIEARKLFDRLGCPVIDVTRRSIEETAAAILKLRRERRNS